MRLALKRDVDLAAVEDTGGERQGLLIGLRGHPSGLEQDLEHSSVRRDLVDARPVHRTRDLDVDRR